MGKSSKTRVTNPRLTPLGERTNRAQAHVRNIDQLASPPNTDLQKELRKVQNEASMAEKEAQNAYKQVDLLQRDLDATNHTVEELKEQLTQSQRKQQPDRGTSDGSSTSSPTSRRKTKTAATPRTDRARVAGRQVASTLRPWIIGLDSLFTEACHDISYSPASEEEAQRLEAEAEVRQNIKAFFARDSGPSDWWIEGRYENEFIKGMNSACSASVRKVFEVSTEIFGIPRSVLRSDDILTNPRAIILRDKRAFLYKDNDPSQSSGYLQSDILVKIVRALLFGAAAVMKTYDGNTPKTNASIWKLGKNGRDAQSGPGVTSGLIAFAAILALYMLEPDKEFKAEGSVTRISYLNEHLKIKQKLDMPNSKLAKRILKFYNGEMFPGYDEDGEDSGTESRPNHNCGDWEEQEADLDDAFLAEDSEDDDGGEDDNGGDGFQGNTGDTDGHIDQDSVV